MAENGEVKDFTSDYARNWTRFGYQYEILESPGEDNANLRQKLSKLYNRAAALMVTASRLEGAKKIEGTDNDYIANVVYDR